jgi:hypothetical protein
MPRRWPPCSLTFTAGDSARERCQHRGMKDRLGAAHWSGIGLNSLAAGVLAVLGRTLQLAAAAVMLVALWPTVLALIGWLRTGFYLSPTPLNLAPGTARAAITATDWVVVRDVTLWLAGAHVLVSAIPATLLIWMAGLMVLALAQGRSGAARDILSRSLRDEYLVQQFLARYGRWLTLGLVMSALALGILLGWFSTRG